MKIKHILIIVLILSASMSAIGVNSFAYFALASTQASTLASDFRTTAMFARMGALDEFHYWYKVAGEECREYISINQHFILFGATDEYRYNHIKALENYEKASTFGVKIRNDWDFNSKQAIKHLVEGNKYTDEAKKLTGYALIQTCIVFGFSVIFSIWLLLKLLYSDNNSTISEYFSKKKEVEN